MQTQTPTLELGQTRPDRGRIEIVLNASIMRQPTLTATAITYERDQEDFSGEALDNLWGYVGHDKVPTKDLLTEAGREIIHHLRSSEDVFKILIPAFGERLFVYASPSLIDQQWSQRLLRELQSVAENSGFSFEERRVTDGDSRRSPEAAGASRSR